ncbi:hypothetical protein COJ96_26450 [Bacillus sp. AFS073361]|uniref:hypothetical protein n=1 Tax=Bacillus sp. AFS073361 TaxID=2033511 RepID=UPI000BF6A174|nr:hypothetical protein [Bacillus sp. AFS073361]PFP17555.1 hypothetical protein COJ96_26450 [Bacillus sp. AFS073361]
MQEEFKLNEQTLKFIIDFERGVESGKCFTIQELVDIFKTSHFHKAKFDTYKKTPNNSMWYAIRRSENWIKVKNGGTYMKK